MTPRVLRLLCLPLAGGLFMLTATAMAQDWPQLLGPNRDGTYTGQEIPQPWPLEGPPEVWKRAVGQGFAGPVVADGKLILFHRVKNEEVIEALEAATGKPLWKHAYATAYKDSFGFDEGPRATPTIADGKVYTFGAEGMLTCVELQTGKPLWSIDTHEKFSVKKGFFGAACSPLVQDGRLLLNVGGSDKAGIVAFDAANGKVLWTATDDPASYSSPVQRMIGGKPHAVFFTRTGLVDLNPQTGEVYHQMRWRARINASVNAANPVVVDNKIFLTTSYNTGAVLLKVNGGKYEEVWSNDESLSAHYTTPVFQQGNLWGIHGRQEYGPSLRCVDLATGKVKWSQDNYRAGTIILAGDKLLVMRDDGLLALVSASTEKYDALAEADILPGVVRAHTAYARGLFYVRDTDSLVCVKLVK